MKKRIDIQKQVTETFEIASQFSEVKVSHKFKEKVMQRLFQEKKAILISWFTPKFQYATLVLVIVINSLAIYYITNSNYDSKIESFAQSFNISSKSDLLN